jgi:hypothetical protein
LDRRYLRLPVSADWLRTDKTALISLRSGYEATRAKAQISRSSFPGELKLLRQDPKIQTIFTKDWVSAKDHPFQFGAQIHISNLSADHG